MTFRNFPDNGQPETTAFTCSFIDSYKAVCHTVDIGCRNPRSIIFNLNDGCRLIVIILGYPHGNDGIGGSITQCIIDQVREHFFK